MPATTATNRFREALVAAIKAKVRELRADGVTAMSLDNLRMVVRAPAGGPLGTNAAYVYREIFNEVAPGLLAALDGVDNLSDDPCGPAEAEWRWDRVRAAIAKAGGVP